MVMTDIEKQAREYAKSEDGVGKYDYLGTEYEAYLDGVEDGVKFALGNQWRDAEKELPEWNKDVVVACQVPDESEIEYCVGYHNRGWHLEDENLDSIGRIHAWLPIPEYKPKGNNKTT